MRKAYKNNVTLDHDVWEDSRKLGVLAVMAHEMAHILWFSKNVRAKSCFQSAFINTSWVKNDRFDPWIDFAEDTMNEHKGTNDHPRRGDNLSPGQVKRIYGRFASLFAAVSPVEDFVETYKLSAFIDGVTRFRVEIDPSSQEVDIKASSAQEPLAGKLRCVRSF